MDHRQCVQVFTKSGVDVRRLFVIGEAVDVDHFDPARTSTSSLRSANRVFGPPREKDTPYFRFLSVRCFVFVKQQLHQTTALCLATLCTKYVCVWGWYV